MTPSKRAWPALLASLWPLAACQTAGPADAPAVLESADDATMATVKSVLAAAVGRAEITLGPGDPTASPTLTVLPPPLHPNETRSPAKPTVFELRLRGEACVVIDGLNEAYPLPGVACRPFTK
ncbi:MAG: hypothetical protein AAFX03_06090 [Pseudomonadota bacterium]